MATVAISKARPDICHFLVDRESTVEEFLGSKAGLSQGDCQQLVELGAVYRNKRRIAGDTALKNGDYLRVHIRPRRFDVSAIVWLKRIVFETPDFLIVDKPCGVPVHATLDNSVENVTEQLSRVIAQRPLVTQRLDILTDGLLLLAKTKQFQSLFNRWLSERKVEKTYRSLVRKGIKPGALIHYMKPDPRAPKEVSLEPKAGWFPCELEILKVSPAHSCTLGPVWELLLRLTTGRTHQIRAQLSQAGSPILGDPLYGERTTPASRMMLQSCHLAFPCPHTGKRLDFSLPSPWADILH